MARCDQFGHALNVGDKVITSAKRFKEKFDGQEATITRFNKNDVVVLLETGSAKGEVENIPTMQSL